jgi:uncharacterized protein with PIN domain
MPNKNYDPVSNELDCRCPKCGADMEPIDSGEDGPKLEQLQLCPRCYLVMWNDESGINVRQGVPMKKDEPAWANGKLTEC